ncbi:cell division protein SepF [Methanobrevibacter sp.]|uniref:cell division protein SepF n=1 Tax=Methanobrevibacter sp. TaxID=66852 RepID=UPI00386730C2
MSFTDDLKRSLGFEETDSSSKWKDEVSNIFDSVRDAIKPKENHNAPQGRPQQQYRPTPKVPQDPTAPHPRPTPVYDDYDDFVIVPEQSYYEIVLIRPKSIDDINYIVDQVLEEKNPVIVDLSFLERESSPNFKLARDKINQMRLKYGAQVLLLARSEDKNLIIISPKKVKVLNKG